MIVMKRALPRRTFLRGVGVALGLPLLDAMIPAMTPLDATAASSQKLRRLSFVYVPMGCVHSHWTVTGETLEALSPILKPLEPIKSFVTVISNLELQGDHHCAHAFANSRFLKLRTSDSKRFGFRPGATIDQIAAEHLGRQSPARSLAMAVESSCVGEHSESGQTYMPPHNLSWATEGRPIEPTVHPRIVFDRLFQSSESHSRGSAWLDRVKNSGSSLDSMTEEVKRIGMQVGTEDRQRVEQYLHLVRDVERHIQRSENAKVDGGLVDLERPSDVALTYAEHVRLMFDLQVLAMQADVTRVFTFQLAREISNRAYPELGVDDSHHVLSHHGNDAVKLAKLATVTRFHLSLFAEFLTKLQSIQEGSGSLLSNSLHVYGSGMGNPSLHDHQNLPILVAGGVAGEVRGGRHVRLARPTELASLYLELLNRIGMKLELPVADFGANNVL